MSDLWLPPDARRYSEGVEKVIDSSPDPALARRLAGDLNEMGIDFATDENFGSSIKGPDSTEILFARAWGHVTTEDDRRLMAAFVESKALERMILDATLELETAGVVHEAEHPLVNELCPALHMRLKQFQMIVPLEFERDPCPMDWRTEAMPGFAFAIWQGDDGDHLKTPYVCTGALSATPGLILPPRQGPSVGRNEKCPCGSGIKFKRCCGR